MDLEQSIAMLSKTEKLDQENDKLKSTVLSVIKENRDLKTKMTHFSRDVLDDFTGKSASSLLQNTFKEKQFRDGLQQTKRQHRTSSPVDFRSFLESSIDTGRAEETGRHSNQVEFALGVKSPKRLVGEIPFQVDRRILSYIFQGHKRLYGFTVGNIPRKIIEVSTHPVTGETDEGYRLYLTQRYVDLKDRLDHLGYKMALHPHFSEFVVNTYGILKDSSDELKSRATIYNDPEFLRKVIMTIAPKKLHDDLLILLSCLCNMAGDDGMPLFLW